MPDPVDDLVRLVRQRLADEADPARAEHEARLSGLSRREALKHL